MFHSEVQRWLRTQKNQPGNGSLNNGILIKEDDVSAEFLREHVFEMRSDRLPSGQSRSTEGLHVLSRGMFQVRDLRH